MIIWQSKADDYSIVQCAMLYGLEPGLQRCFERHGAYEMFQELKLIFQKNARIERYEDRSLAVCGAPLHDITPRSYYRGA